MQSMKKASNEGENRRHYNSLGERYPSLDQVNSEMEKDLNTQSTSFDAYLLVKIREKKGNESNMTRKY